MVGLLQRAAAGLRAASEVWFGPLQPMAPVAPAETAGRAFDYVPGYNLVTRPRAYERITAEELRGLADNYDLLRLVIETRKDQLARLPWSIQARDPKARRGTDPRVRAITQALAYPDREHDWATWLRELLEDMLVLDAATIYPRRTRGGSVYSLELIDGGTIKRVLDDWGRTPAPPEVAYQQILKGVVASDYTADQLFYLPRNCRSNRVYGLSQVEQIVMTINIGLRRQVHQLQYYTEGTVPEALMGVPETWSTEQIGQFQSYFDALLTDNTASRRRVRFVPAAMSKAFIQTKEGVLKDDYDDWLARLVCYAFGVSPQSLVKMMNRATAETAKSEAAEEGVAPQAAWVKGVVDRLVAQVWDSPDLEFAWVEESDTDPTAQAQVADIYVRLGALTLNEVRSDLGRDPLPGCDEPMIYTATGAVPVSQALRPDAAPTGLAAEGMPALPDGVPPSGDGRPLGDLVKADEAIPLSSSDLCHLASLWASILARTAHKVAARLADTLNKADDGDPTLPEIPHRDGDALRAPAAGLDATVEAAVTPADLQEAVEATRPILERMAASAASAATKALLPASPLDLTAITNPNATAWAQTHSAELLSNVTQTTRNGLRSVIAEGVERGESVRQLSDRLLKDEVFSPARAQLIAQNELLTANGAGRIMGWRAMAARTGLPWGKEWAVSTLENHCPACQGNALGGPIPLDEEFPSGHDTTPAHPRCTCTLAPVVRKPA